MVDESLYPPDWLAVADRDWQRIEVLLAARDAEAAAFFLQQAVEKYLKATLLKHGWQLKRIHQLPFLLDELVTFRPEFDRFREIGEQVSGYYLAERYPVVIASDLSCETIAKQRDQLRALVELVKRLVS